MAQRAVSPDGQLLYDNLKIYANDRSIVKRSISDAMDALALRFPDMAKLESTDTQYVFSLYAPDVSDAKNVLEREIKRYVSMKVAADWFLARFPDAAAYFAGIADTALAKIVIAVRTREKPTR